jgi:hypothetical protein
MRHGPRWVSGPSYELLLAPLEITRAGFSLRCECPGGRSGSYDLLASDFLGAVAARGGTTRWKWGARTAKGPGIRSGALALRSVVGGPV